MSKAVRTYPRNDKRVKRNIVKVRNPEPDGKKFLYFASQRDCIDWFLVNYVCEEEYLPYIQVENHFSYNIAHYEEFNGIECKHHSGSGATLTFELAPKVY